MGKNRNRKGGKNFKKYKKKRPVDGKRELLFKDTNYDQEYFTITKMLGDGRCLGNGSDGREEVLCVIRGSMRKRVWINVGDIVLGSYRETSKPVVDIIHKYTESEIILLKKQGAYFAKNTKEDNMNDINEESEEELFTFEDL